MLVVDNMKKTITAILMASLLILINLNIGIIVSSDSSSSVIDITYKNINNRPANSVLREIFIWILKLLGIYKPGDDSSDNNGDDSADDNSNDTSNKATQPQVYTKDYDIFTNSHGEKILRFHGILEKTGTAGTGIATPDFSWTWFEYKINGVTYETEPLMCRGDGLPRTFMYGIPIAGSSWSPEIPPGTYYFKACSKNAAELSDYGEWIPFKIS